MENILDLRKEQCPMNFVKTKMRLETMKSKERLKVLLTDSVAVNDIPLSLNEEGYKIIEKSEKDGVFELVIEKP